MNSKGSLNEYNCHYQGRMGYTDLTAERIVRIKKLSLSFYVITPLQ
jgi:hypothetical protein